MRPLLIAAALAAVAVPTTLAVAQDRYGAPSSDPQGYQDGEQRRYDERDPRLDRDDRGRGPRPEAVFYTDDRFGGRTLTLDRGVRRLGERDMEDRISSIRIVSGRWLVCSDTDFRGRCVTLDRSVGRLSRLDMNDKISSVRPIRAGRDGPDDGYRGN